MNTEFVPYKQALALKELGFDEPCLAHLIGFGDGTKENGKYKINQQQVFYPNDYISSDDKAEELGLYPFGMCGVPLYQQAFRWFREKHGLSGNIDCCDKLCEWNIKSSKLDKSIFSNNIQSYEEAELACLKNLIEIVKQQP